MAVHARRWLARDVGAEPEEAMPASPAGEEAVRELRLPARRDRPAASRNARSEGEQVTGDEQVCASRGEGADAAVVWQPCSR